MDEEILDKIKLEDIQDLIIQKKFVRINSEKYTEEAFNYIKSLIDQERSILFDEDTNRIYTLGKYYGGDELKENLLYFSKLLSIDIDDNILSELNASQNSDTLAIKGKGALNVNIYNDKYNTIELEYKLNEAVNNNIFTVKEKNEYNLYVNENGKISLNEYIYPQIIIDEILLESNNSDEIIDINYKIISSIDVNEWPLLNIMCEDCEILDIDKLNNKLTVRFYHTINGKIIFDYSDGKNTDHYEYIQKWTYKCIYGLYESNRYTKLGEIIKNDDNFNMIIDQTNNSYAYVILPKHIKPIFIDNLYNRQGAWHKITDTNIVNTNLNNIYITDNSGLGKIEWKIINKKI